MANLKETMKAEEAIWNRTQQLFKSVQGICEHPDHELAKEYVLSDTYLRVTIRKLSDLTRIRKMLREVFGGWTDKISTQFVSTGSFITTWKCPGIPVSIWYFCSPDEIPAGLQKPGCKVVEVDIKEKQYVCNLDD